jgi:hypothetical protein
MAEDSINAYTMVKHFLKEEEVHLAINAEEVIGELVWLLMAHYMNDAEAITNFMGTGFLYFIDKGLLTKEDVTGFVVQLAVSMDRMEEKG